MSDTLGIAVLGAGRIGMLHARNVARLGPAVRLVGVADVSEAAAAQATHETSAGRATTNYADLVNDPDVHGVVIATPTNTHAEIIAAAAAAGKHILCEKPIALTLRQTDPAVAAAKRAGVILQIGFNRRYDPAYARARERISRGDIGEPWYIRATSRDPGLASREYLASSGGIFKDSVIHDFDIVRWLMGREVEELYATGSVLVDPMVGELGDVDTTVTTLRFAGGALGSIENSRRAVYGYDVHVEVLGSAGKLVIGYERATAVEHYGEHGVSHDHVFWFLERFANAYAAEVAEFARCIREGIQPGSTGDDGRHALQLAVAADRSLLEHRPVRLEEVTDD